MLFGDPGFDQVENIHKTGIYTWNTGTLQWEKQVPITGGGGGGGAVTIADGADTVEGALADAAIITDTTGTINGKIRGLVKWAFERMPSSLGQKTMANSLGVTLASDQSSVPVTVGNFPATQPVSGTVTANQGGAPWQENITQFGGNAVATGTGASGVGIPRVTVANDSNILATQSGTWTVQQGTPPWVMISNKTNNATGPGATNLGTLPAIATAASPTFTEGNQVGLSTDLSGALRIGGTILASSSARATAAEPSYAEGTDQPFSQDLMGHLRTRGYAEVSDARPGGYIDGDVKALSLTSDGRLRASVSPADMYLEFFRTDTPCSFNIPDLTSGEDLYAEGAMSPWP